MTRPTGAIAMCIVTVVLGSPSLTHAASAATGDITTLAGAVATGPATSVGQDVSGVAVRGTSLYIADRGHHVVRLVDTGTGHEVVLAGNGGSGFSGDGGPAIAAQLSYPTAVAVDASGNVFITSSNRVRKVDTSGIITTVAGNGFSGFSGDGGPATSARLQNPAGLAVDGFGDVFIADSFNLRIRRVTSSGIITTMAGNGSQGFNGDGGPATSAQLYQPTGVAVDASGNVFIADYGNPRVRRVDSAGTITTVAGVGTFGFSGDGGPATSAQLYYPTGVSVDSTGNLFIADTSNSRLRKVTSSGTITTVAGNGGFGFSGDGGLATAAQLNGPKGAAIDTSGNVFIADSGNFRIRRIGTSGSITSVAGNGTSGFSGDGGLASSAQLSGPESVAVDGSGNVFIADSGSSRIRRVSASGTITTVAGNGTSGFSGDGGPATLAQLNQPNGVAVDIAGNLYITDRGNARVRKVGSSGTITTVAGNGTFGFSGDGGPATSASLNAAGLAVDTSGIVFIVEDFNNRIRKVDTSGVISTVVGNGTSGFSGDGGPATSASLMFPKAVAVDNAGNLLVADTFNHRIRRVDGSGTISTVAGSGTFGFSGDGGPSTSAQLNQPSSLAVDTSGNVFIADSSNLRIRRINTIGAISTVAGSGTLGFSGDGGAAILAEFSYSPGVAVDFAGNVLIADRSNNRIRRVSSTAVFTPGTFTPLTPARILDTRGGGTGTCTPSPCSFIGGGGTLSVQVAGQGGVPASGVSAVVMNVTVTEPGGAASSFLTAYPSDAPQPLAANLNYVAGQTVPNLVTVKLGADGRVKLYNNAGTTQVIIDVAGYYDDGTLPAGSRFNAVTPARILDTRNATGTCTPSPCALLGPATSLSVDVDGQGGLPASGVTAVVMNVTVTEPGGAPSSFLTAYPSDAALPLAANLNYLSGQTVPNLVTVKLGADGRVKLYNNAGNVHIIADVAGWYGPAGAVTGARFTPVTPARILDTRGAGTGTCTPSPCSFIGGGGTLSLQVAGAGGVPASGASAVVFNTTVTQPSAASGFMTAYPSDATLPLAANLNFVANQTVPNLVAVKLGADGRVKLYNNAGTTHVIADVAGWFNTE